MTPDADDQISLLDFALVLARYKWLIVGLPFLAAVVAAGISMVLTPIYTGASRLLPPQQSQSVASGLLGTIGQLGGLAGGGFAGALGIKNPSDIYVGMLRSRTVADALIDRFDLMKVYNARLRSDARMRLGGASNIAVGKDGLISVEVEDRDPKLAAALANGYIEELEKLTAVLAVTEAGRRRLFFERQLAQAKDNLLKAELAARSAMEEGGLASVDAQGRTLIQTAAMLRARVTAKEVELNSMRGFATEQNPAFHQVLLELSALREQLAKLERGESGATQRAGKTAEGLKNVSLMRELRYNEVLFELLARQYEVAKVDEAKDGAVIQVLDKAIEPDRRTSPKRFLIVLTTALITLLFAVVLAFLLEALRRAKSTPDGARRLSELASRLRPWR